MILITGATGFLGSQLAYDLASTGSSLRCLKRSDSAIPEKLLSFSHLIEWSVADVTDYLSLDEAFVGVTHVYHCAAIVSFNPALTKKLYNVNIEGTSNVVNLALEHHIKKLVHVSSIASLGSVKEGFISEKTSFDEQDSHSAYAISKHKSELEVWRGIAEGLTAVIVNPSVIIGPTTQWHGGFTPIVVKAHAKIKYYTPGVTGLVDVRDVSRAMIALMDSEIEGKRFILSADNVSFKEWFTWMNAEFGHAAPTISISKTVLEIGWRLSWLYCLFTAKKNRFPKSVARSAYHKTFYTNDCIKQEIGFTFTPVELSVKQTCESYLLAINATDKRN